VCTNSIASLVFARSDYAGLYQLANGVALYAARAHTTTFRVLSHVGYTVSHNSVTSAIKTAKKDVMAELAGRMARREAFIRFVMDNVQFYSKVHDFRLGSRAKMVIGCAATAIEMENCMPAAFDSRVLEEERAKARRKDLTVQDLLGSINSKHMTLVSSLHWLMALVSFVPTLSHHKSAVNKLFRTQAAKRPMPANHRTKIHPLGTSGSEHARSIERNYALVDFLETQLKVDTAATKYPTLVPVSGDGMTFEQIHRLKKFLASQSQPRHRLAHIVPVLELWHTKWADLSRIFAEHFNLDAIKDPSALSGSAAAIQAPLPTNTKKVDFYPSAHTITSVAKAQMINCWSLLLGTEDVVQYFADLEKVKALPALDELLSKANILVHCYSTTRAYEQALGLQNPPNPGSAYDFPIGEWSPDSGRRVDGDLETNGDSETNNFTGDRVLANSILFLRDATWYMEMCHAVAGGDIGRVLEILKIWIFTFEGSSHTKYSSYLLEVYCNLHYEFSDPLKDAILSNYLVNRSGIEGQFLEADLLQGHLQFGLELYAQHKAKEFDDPSFCELISPAIEELGALKKDREASVLLSSRTKTHSAPHLKVEYKTLLRIYADKKLHMFCAGRALGHVARD
ncbi:hypothetical protein BOTBODRAFT_82813, partial [Botryobasidium botryosum FD-172 SS1]